MAVITIGFENYSIVGTNPVVASDIVGSDPWGDADSGTYTEVTLSEAIGITYTDQATADLVIPTLGTVSDWSVEVDLTATNSGGTGTGLRCEVGLYDTSNAYVCSFFNTASTDGFTAQPSTAGVMETLTLDNIENGDLSTVTALLAAGGSMRVKRYSRAGGYDPPADYTVRCHRIAFTVTDDSVAATATAVPHRRIFGRSL
jgi:hypothetical protein